VAAVTMLWVMMLMLSALSHHYRSLCSDTLNAAIRDWLAIAFCHAAVSPNGDHEMETLDVCEPQLDRRAHYFDLHYRFG